MSRIFESSWRNISSEILDESTYRGEPRPTIKTIESGEKYGFTYSRKGDLVKLGIVGGTIRKIELSRACVM